jgi:DivIVA domain-containing protein
MAITPQAIKDQEFQVKFRGYDTVEVKAYLDLIAEEFFELLEQVRQQIDELDVITAERDALQNRKTALEEELSASHGSSAEYSSEFARRDSEVAALRQEITSLKNVLISLKEEKAAKEKELASVQGQMQQREDILRSEREKNSALVGRIDTLMQKNEELRREEIDFKSTLIAAQQFTNEMKRKSESEARAIVEQARAEAEKLRQETFAELASYPAEIERLKMKRNRVKEDLETVLKLSLENLEIFQETEVEKEDDYGDLFRSVKLNKDGLIDTDELDAITMNFDLPGTDQKNMGMRFSMKDEMEKPESGLK